MDRKKKLLKETFDVRVGRYKKQDGTYTKVIYIDPTTSEDTFKYKDTIKNKYGAVWNKNLKTWCWFSGDGQQERIIQTKVKPCIEYLTSVESNNGGERRNPIQIIDELIDSLNDADLPDVTQNSTVDIKNKLEGFKQELVNCMSTEEFKQKMSPIIKFQRAQGHQFSFMNALLIWLQNPKATMVKSKTNWIRANRNIIQGSKGILLKKPSGRRIQLSDIEKNQITSKFCQQCGVSSTNELSVGEKEQLNIKLQGKFENDHTFQWYQAFDISETEQMSDKEDLIGNRDTSNIEWYDDKGKETQKSAMLCDAILKFAESLGIKISKVSDLGGARGVSKSGAIDVLDNVAKNEGLFNTLCHELSHELLHQRFLSTKNPELKNYFIGTSQGRAKVEQQAELCAWIVLKNYGYDMPTNLNYVGIWGMDEKNAPYVFDTVSSVASYIVNGIDKQINNLNESKRMKHLKESKIPSGLEIAKICGCEQQYLSGRQEIQERKKIHQYLKEELNHFYKSLIKVK